MSELVQIAVPPLHQSTVKVMACPYSYGLQFIKGIKPATSPEADRGTEIHEVAAAYTDHCTRRHVPSDWAKFDELARGKGPEAVAILAGLRDTLVIEHEFVADTEWEFYLDEDFQPVSETDRLSVHYSGIIDTLFLFHQQKGGIDDWKSHPTPFVPPDVQSDMYSTAVFQYFPELQQVEFRYRFVRYPNCVRSYVYHRDDLKAIMQRLRAHRERQISYHQTPVKELPVLPGPHCCYCPALANATCPIPKDLNPYSAHTKEEWLRLLVQFGQQATKAKEVLTAWVDATGGRESPGISVEDGNGKQYTYGPRETHSAEYPLIECITHLTKYGREHPEDTAWIDKLTISATKLKSYLKSKKREQLREDLYTQAANPITRIRTGVYSNAPEEREEKEENYGGE